MKESKKHAPATLRNREPIYAVLARVLPKTGLVLEVASGTGEHSAWMAPQLPGLIWQPSDADPDMLPSIEAWTAERAATNVRPPLLLDVCAETWPIEHADAVFCANMIHIAPWSACLALLRGTAAILPSDGPLVLYGPFMIGGEHTAPSNAAFDARLRERNPNWGVRDLDEVVVEARKVGMRHHETIQMPGNNLCAVFQCDKKF